MWESKSELATEIEDYWKKLEDINLNKIKLLSELETIHVELVLLLDKVTELKPPEPDQPVVAAGRKFYFRRF